MLDIVNRLQGFTEAKFHDMGDGIVGITLLKDNGAELEVVGIKIDTLCRAGRQFQSGEPNFKVTYLKDRKRDLA